MNKVLGILLLMLAFSASTTAQISVNDNENLIDIIRRLEGTGVEISNISYRFSSQAQKRPVGSFTDDFGFIGLDRGLLLTTGAAINALGPNSVSNRTQSNEDDLQDPDLIPYIKDYNDTNMAMHDVCYVEFDIVSAYPILSFDYIFASEEYIEFLDFHDVFVFLISGPGIAGNKNIALVPRTNIPVSVGSINPDRNNQYYIDNGSGATPWINIDTQYDGYTTVLNASSNVIPCETYHIKLAIADVRDGAYDSGVFIEERSFSSSNVKLNVVYEHSRFKNAIEGCNDAYIVFKRPSFVNISEKVRYDFHIKGTAVNGTDYNTIADSIVIPAGQDSAFVTISPFLDAIPDDNEYVRLVLKSPCSEVLNIDSIQVSIKESFPYFIPSEKLCEGQSVELNKSYIPTDSIVWDFDPYLSCLQCSSPTVSNPLSANFRYSVTDLVSGCKARDSLSVEVVKLKMDFEFYQDPCYTTLDYFFINNSQNATYYLWNFGDNTTSTESSLIHQYPFTNTKDQQTYNVSLVVGRENPSCSMDTTFTIQISDPLFIPNLITRNSDGKNDEFKLLGIDTDCWNLNIYNRWGSLVYNNGNYKNDFDGEDLKSGAYFFNITNHNGDREFKGWLHILNE